MKPAFIFFSVVAISGCATSMGYGPTMEQVAAALNSRFAGRQVSEMIDRYGQPAWAFDAANGIRVLEWRTSGTVRLHENVTSTTTGRIGDLNTYPGATPVPYSQTTTTRQGYNVNVACKMQAGFRQDNTVERVGLGGSTSACASFMP